MSEDLKNNDPMQEKSAGGEVKSAAPETQAVPEVQAAPEAQTAPEAQAAPEVQAAPEDIFCPQCGMKNAAQARFCSACGTPLGSVEAAAQAPSEPETENTYESAYTGSALKRLLINLGVLLGSICTLGIAYPFLVCIKEKWLKSHTFVNGRQLEFDGNGAQLIGKYIIWLLLSVVTFGIYALLRLPLNMQRWKTKHTHVKGYRIDGKKGESKFTGSMFGLFGIRLLRMIMVPLGFITLGFASAWAKLVRLRWFNEKKIIDGVRIHNDAQLKQYWVKRVVWFLLMIVTVFIHRIFFRANSELKFLSKHDKFANPSVFPRPEVSIEEMKAHEAAAKKASKQETALRMAKIMPIVSIIGTLVLFCVRLGLAFTSEMPDMIGIIMSVFMIFMLVPASRAYVTVHNKKDADLSKIKILMIVAVVVAVVCTVANIFVPTLIQAGQ